MSRPIRLGFNARVFSADRVRSFTRYTQGLLHALSELPERKEIHLFSDRRIARTHAPTLEVFRLHRSYVRPHLAWEQLSLPMELGLSRVELFHSTTNVGVPLFPLSNVKRVVTVHDLKPFDDVRARLPRSLQGLRTRASQEVSWQASFGADALICVNHATARRIETRYPELAPKVKVIPLAVASAFSPSATGQPSDEETRLLQRYGLETKEYVLYVGGYEPRKNVELLIRAHQAAFREKGKQAPLLVLVGDFADASEELLSLKKKNPRLRSLGYMPEPELVGLYRNARCAVVPAKEGDFGLGVLEAQACGTPVFASDLDSLREAADGAAEHFGANDPAALRALLHKAWEADQASWLAELSARGLRRTAQLSWAQVAEATFAVYRELLHSSPVVAPR